MRKKKVEIVQLYGRSILPSKEIEQISDEWTKSANEIGDVGSCVMGAGIEFTYNGVRYHLHPRSKWQGSCSWEHNREKFMKKLEAVGCSEVRYAWGVCD